MTLPLRQRASRPRDLRQRAAWLVPATLVGAWLAASPSLGAPGSAAAGDDPQAWLQKMNRALAMRNYDGTFFHLSEGRVETMRIVHRVRAGRVTERLLSLDGSGREFVRNDEELTCYLPDQRTVLVEPRPDHGPFLGTLPQFGADVNDFYRIESLAPARVLGRAVHVIAVTPKDQFRFGYRLWLDDQSAMPLKTQLCDSHGQVIEQILFAKLDMPETIADSELSPAAVPKGMRWVRQGSSPGNAPASLASFRASRLPPGFRLTVSGAQTLGGATVPATHLVYSDGLATVSVFVEDTGGGTGTEARNADGKTADGGAAGKRADGKVTDGKSPDGKSPDGQGTDASTGPPREGLARVGSGFVFSTVVQGHQVTAVGEVPAQTVEFIAHSVKSYGAAESPNR